MKSQAVLTRVLTFNNNNSNNNNKSNNNNNTTTTTMTTTPPTTAATTTTNFVSTVKCKDSLLFHYHLQQLEH